MVNTKHFCRVAASNIANRYIKDDVRRLNVGAKSGMLAQP